MRHSHPLTKPAAAAAALALLAVAVLTGTATPARAATSALASIDFEDGTTGTWIANDAATLTVVDGQGSDLTKVLQVSDRGASHFGLQSPTGVFEPGVAYTFSADVLLSADADVRFIAYDESADNTYNWVGATQVAAGAWTTVSGTFTFESASIATAKAYIEVANTDDYLVDNVIVTASPGQDGGQQCEAGTATVAAFGFDSTVEPWTGRGVQELATTDESRTGDGALAVTGRTESWHGAALDVTGLLTAGTYQITAFAKLPESASGPAEVNLGMNEPGAQNEYPWVGDRVSIDGQTWAPIGGSYTVKPGEPPATLYIESAQSAADLLLDDVLITHEVTCDAEPEPGTTAFATGFEDGLDGWELRDPGVAGDPVVAVTTDQARTGAQSAQISGRTSQGHGLRYNVTDELVSGVTYAVTAWVRFADGAQTDDVWLSLENTQGDSTTYSTLKQFTGMSNSEWVELTANFTMPPTDTAYLYFETAWQGEEVAGNTSTFYVDDISAVVPEAPVVQDITPIKDTLNMPVGVAIDSRETVGAGAQMVTKHFDQVTAENYMKPEAWYNAAGEFSPSPEIDTLMDFAQANDLNVYGHVLVWHSQTPDWFFMDGDRPLTSSAADQEVLKIRMHDHIFNVARYLSENWGEFGAGNPLSAFDVANEVIDDSAAYADGLRRSSWYDILGESFLDLAFGYANDAFNEEYAAVGAVHPVTLFINDYNTEQSGKRGRYLALVDRLVSRDVPIDGVGHQFHLSLSTPVEHLAAALDEAERPGLKQAVTEFDVTTGVPESQAKFIDQGYYYRDAFDIFRSHENDLFSVTIWGLNDARSWRDSSGGPLAFDDDYSAKPAYYGIVADPDGGTLPDRLRAVNVFAEAVAVNADAVTNPTWQRLPFERIDDASSFQLRWSPEYLTVYLTTQDDSVDATDGVQLQVGDVTFAIGRDGVSDVDASVTSNANGYSLVARVPLGASAAQGDTRQFDVRVVNGDSVSGWNSSGVMGTLSLIEPLSYVEVPFADQAPTIDGTLDDVWAEAVRVATAKTVSGTPAATGSFASLWRDNTLYVYAHVVDANVDLSGSDPWTQDSVEIYVDAGNVKNGSYRYDDTQIRINADNVLSFGAGDELFQENRVESATRRVADGYVVEVAISLLESGGLDSFQGVDFQVNDATAGARDGIRNWADPTGTGYQSTVHWGVAKLVNSAGGTGDDTGDGTNSGGDDDAPDSSDVPNEAELTDANRGTITVPSSATPGQQITVGFGPGQDGNLMNVWIFSIPRQIGAVTVMSGKATVTIPEDTTLGEHRIVVYDADGALLGWDDLSVVAAGGGDELSGTGADVAGGVAGALLLVSLGGILLAVRRRASL